VDWNIFFIFFGEVANNLCEEIFCFLSNSPEVLFELLPKFQQERQGCFPEVAGVLFKYTGLGWLGGWEPELFPVHGV